MSEIMKVDTVQQYNDYFGVETLHKDKGLMAFAG